MLDQRGGSALADRLALHVDYEGWAQVIPLDGPVAVGRSPECAVKVPDPRLSRQHAVFRPTVGGCEVEDLGSQAGTFVGGVRVGGPRALAVGERVDVGPLTVVLSRAEPEEHPLVDVVADLYAGTEVDELLAIVVSRAIGLLGAERGAVLVRGVTDVERAVARDAQGADLPAEALLSRSTARAALARGETVAVADFQSVESGQVPVSAMAEGLRAVVCVPLPGSAGPIGVLYLDAHRAVGFAPTDIRLLEALATHAALAIERANVRETSLRREVDRRASLEVENAQLRARLSDGAPIGNSPGMRRVGDLVRQLAPSEVTVCLTGETGTGKEVVARWLHTSSARAGRPFVAVDCGSIPEGLVESELFGHTRGAFTGAVGARAGHFREADGGTLFLDEIGELPLALQTRLLRVLQDRTVQPVGSTQRVPVDVRVVCATHRDLEKAVEAGTFRQDLFYRLAVVRLELPPLRDRGEDVLLLARHFLTQGGAGRFEGFAPDARAAMLAYAWPGNVRELQHRVQRALVLGQPPWISAVDLGLAAAPAVAPGVAEAAPERVVASGPIADARAVVVARFERAYVEALLVRTSGNMAAAAEIAGLTRQGMHRLVTAHGIDRKKFRHGGAQP